VKCAVRRVVRSTAQGRCSVDAGQIWDPYQRFFDSGTGSAVRNNDNSFIPFNNLALYTSPGNPKLPANLQPPAVVPAI
jgi:hypothetical protein